MQGPMPGNGPMSGNMGGPGPINGPMNNGPQMNGPMTAAMNMGSPNGPIGYILIFLLSLFFNKFQNRTPA